MRTFRLIQNSMLVFCFLLCSCSKDDKPEEKKEKTLAEIIIGSWIEQPPYFDGFCDTLVFKSDSTIDKYIPLVGKKYRIISDDSLTIRNDRNIYVGFDFKLYGDTSIVFYNFVQRSVASVIRDITFKKLK